MPMPFLVPPRESFATSVTGAKRERKIHAEPADPAGTVAHVDSSAALSEYFGFEAFRRGQREAVEAAVAGRDVLVVMPTGSGKSLCYQLPALMREDVTIVVSPLVALMQDQVDALRARGLGSRVALVNAQQGSAANAETVARACEGELRLLYVAPERFSSPGFVERIRRAEIGLFVVDEAHCVSQWGHDFRPDYFRLADAARHLGADAIVASTATATPQVASDIVRRLSLRDPGQLPAGVPAWLEAYCQEAGGAGRAGEPARAILLAENRDKALHVHFIKRDEVDERLPGRLAARLAAEADGGALPGMGPARYDVDAVELARSVDASGEQLRSLIGHLSRAGVIEPSPSSPDRVAGRIVGEFDGLATARCRQSVAEAAKARWRQYRDIWAYVESGDCRRRSILRHFGDHSEPHPRGDCCDACGAVLVPEPPRPEPEDIASLDDAIVSIALSAKPSVGRTTCAEILHGARTKKIERNSYDGLPAYGTSSGMRRSDILRRIDELIDERRLMTSDGPYPVLRAARARLAA